MIKLTRPSEPKILCDNSATWTRDIMNLVAKYGSYKEIPFSEKEAALKFYRHDDIKNALKESSFHKCAFCEGKPEETGFAEVEHFYPKSIHTDKTFEWTNLLYCCKACNNKKLDHDTQLLPIINPYELDPRECFTYTDIMIEAKPGVNQDIAERTIKVCGLSDKRLFSPRSGILASFRIFEADIHDALTKFQQARTLPNKKRCASMISNALSTIEELVLPSAKFSNYCTHMLSTSDVYQQAKKTLEEFTRQNM